MPFDSQKVLQCRDCKKCAARGLSRNSERLQALPAQADPASAGFPAHAGRAELHSSPCLSHRRHPLSIPEDPTCDVMRNAMDQTITELATTQFHRQLLEKRLAQIERHRARGRENFCELGIGEGDWHHKVRQEAALPAAPVSVA